MRTEGEQIRVEHASFRRQVPDRVITRNLPARYLAPLIITLAVLATIVLWRFQHQPAIMGRADTTDRIILQVMDTELELREMQSALRVYLLTSDKRRLAEIGEARDAFEKNLTTLAALVADNPTQERRVQEIKDILTRAIESLISQGPGGQFRGESVVEVHTQAHALFDSLDNFVAAEHRLRIQRAARQRTDNTWLLCCSLFS
jgi:CHASE3 domain sensor protein